MKNEMMFETLDIMIENLKKAAYDYANAITDNTPMCEFTRIVDKYLELWHDLHKFLDNDDFDDISIHYHDVDPYNTAIEYVTYNRLKQNGE